MSTDTFDVIIAGAGPAGANLARELSHKGYKILLIEKSKEIGQPNFSSAGTPDYTIREFALPKSIIAASWDKLEIATPDKSHIWKYSKTRGYVLKFNDLKRFLTEDAAQNGAKVLIGTTVTKPILKNKKATGVEFTGIQKGEAFAKIIVDATGPTGTIAQSAGLRSATLCAPSVALEFIMAGVKFPKTNTLSFFLGNSFAPKGYAWVFPMGKHTAKIGLGIYESSTFTHKKELEILNEFVKRVTYLKNAQPLELHGSSLFITGGIKNTVRGNIIAIGDAAAQVNPLGAEGIRHALRSSRMAKEAIDEALASSNISKLENYQKAWRKHVGRKWQISQLLSKIVYKNFTGGMYDQALTFAENLTADEIYEIFFEYNFKLGLKGLKGNLKKKMFTLALKNKFSPAFLKNL